MTRLTFALLLPFLVLSCSAIPAPEPRRVSHAKVPFATKFGVHPDARHVIKADRARIAHIQRDAATRKAGTAKTFVGKHAGDIHARAPSVDVANVAVSYIASVQVGSQGPFDLIIDTGSSNTWVGAGKRYRPSSITGLFEVEYGSGTVFGYETTNSLTLGPNLVVRSQSIGAAIRAQGFEGVDGILGIGPTDLTEGTTSAGGTVSTVTDNLRSEGVISTASVGILFAPASNASSVNGELTFGGVDTTKIKSNVSYTALTKTSPANTYWGIDQAVSYGGSTILKTTAGIVDTGTTLLYLATDAYQQYVLATGAVLDSNTGLLAITEAQYENLQPLVFNLGAAGTHELSANAQIWPRALNEFIGGENGTVYLVVNDLGSNSGEGLDFIDGFAFLERFYTVFDSTNSRFGIAATAFTNATSN